MPLRVHYRRRPKFAEPAKYPQIGRWKLYRRIRKALIYLMLPALVFIVPMLYYWPVLSSGFVSDDFFYHATFTWSIHDFIERLVQIRAGELHFPFFRPMVIESFRIDYMLWGDDPVGFHLTNLLIHSLNCVLLYFLARSAGLQRFGSTACALFFGLYPANPEAVTWISGRFDLMAMMFLLGSFLMWTASRMRNDIRWMFPSALAFMFAILSKEVAAAGLLFLPLLDWILHLRTKKQWNQGVGWQWKWYIVFFAVVLCVIAFRFWLYRDLGGYLDEHGQSTFLQAGIEKVWSNLVMGDLLMLVTPVNRILWPEWNVAWRYALIITGSILGLILIETVLRASIIDSRRDISRIVLIGSSILWILIFLIPVATIEGVKPSLDYSRFLYIPAAGLSIWIGAAGDYAWHIGESARRISVLLLAVILLFSGIVLRSHNQTWEEAGEIAMRIQSVMVIQCESLPDNSNIYIVNYPWLWKGAHCAPIDYGVYLEYRYGVKGVYTYIIHLEPEDVDEWWRRGSGNWNRPGIGFEWNRTTGSIRYIGRYAPAWLLNERLIEFLGRDFSGIAPPGGTPEVEVLPEPQE